MKTTSIHIVNEAIKLRQSGWSYAKIGKHLDISATTVMNHFNRVHSSKKFERTCLLQECGVVFSTIDPRQTCCCRSHTKLYCNRKAKETCVDYVECALPECKQMVARIDNRYRKFCCKAHHSLNLRRWGRKKNKGVSKYEFYKRLLHYGTPCMVWGERYVVDEHHTEYTGNRSNKKSDVVFLCPTHHMAIHRGFAKIENGHYVWLTESLRKKLQQKQPNAVKAFCETQVVEVNRPNRHCP